MTNYGDQGMYFSLNMFHLAHVLLTRCIASTMANFGSYEDTQTGFEHESYVYDPQFSALSILCVSCFLIFRTT